MILSEESSRAIFEMGTVELIELKQTSETARCPSCTTCVLEGTTTCQCGKLRRPNESAWDRIREAFEALKAPYYRTAPIISKGNKFGPDLWQKKTIIKPETYQEVQRKRTNTFRYEIGGRTTMFIEHLNKHTIGQVSGSSTSILSRTSTSAMII